MISESFGEGAIQPDSPPLALGDFQHFLFETFALADGGLEFGVGVLEVGGPVLDARFQLVVGATQRFLGPAPLDELADLAADDGHHVQ